MQRATKAARSLRSQIRRDREVETPVKRLVVFLSGLATTITGVFIRSCESGVEMTLGSAWCGKAPPGVALLGGHAHCAGCAIALAGLAMMGLAAASRITARGLKNAGARADQ
jgi:hypothetical protein